MSVGAALRFALATLAVALLSGCDTWPPHKSSLSRHFKKNRAAFESLEDKLEASEYFRVSQTGIINIPRFSDGHEVYADIDRGEYNDTVEIADDPEWEALFQKVGMWGVASYEGTVSFFPPGAIDIGKREFDISIVHRASPELRAKICDLTHMRVRCGWCAVELDDTWNIDYRWRPRDWTSRYMDETLSGEMTMEEASDANIADLNACYREGFAEMGYDMSRW